MRPWTWLVPVAVLLTGIIAWLQLSDRPSGFVKPAIAPGTEIVKVPERAPQGPAKGPGLSRLSEPEREEVKKEFEDKLRPALLRWAVAYSGHIPFDANSISPADFYGRMKTGKYANYTFMVNGATLVIDDMNGEARVRYLNTTATEQLMVLPKGESPDVNSPVTRDEVAQMIKNDSGKEFNQWEIRMVPTALSSAMQGGVHVMVGGDPQNSGSWLYTLTFGPDKMLNYYMKGAEVLSQSVSKK